jgi:hypothetical protein
MNPRFLPQLLTRLEAAELLQRTLKVPYGASTLERLACEGTGPPYYKVGGKCRYPEPELRQWAAAQFSQLLHKASDGRPRRTRSPQAGRRRAIAPATPQT